MSDARLTVHFLEPLDPPELAALQAQLAPAIVLTSGPVVPADCAILVGGRPQRADLEAAPALRALIIPWAGLPEGTRTLMAEFPQVAVHNLHYNSGPVAEMALALLLAAARRLVPADRALRAGDWTPRYRPADSPLLAGSTALVLGYGAIGQQVTRLLRGLGMSVQAIRRSLHAPESIAPDLTLYPSAALSALLPGAAALLICVPHTPETTGVIGAAELALLPPHAVLVNISRGPVVDELALYTALREGRIYGAGLDVWYRYPPDEAAQTHTLPATYPFHELDNVVLSPHRAAHTLATDALRLTHLAALLNAAAAGDPIPNQVDVAAGY